MTTAPLPSSDVEALHAEIDSLRQQLSGQRSEASRRRRTIGAWVLAVLAILATTMALTTTWTYRTVNNTDLFVKRVAPIIEEPAVVAEVSDRVSTSIVNALDLQQRVEGVLPEQSAILAAPIASAAQNYLEQATASLIGTDQFQAAWETALAASHDLAITVLKGDTQGAVTNANGEITVNLVPVINTVLQATSDFLSQLLGRDINLPAITADQVDQAISAIETQFGVDLPADFGQVTLFSSDALATAQNAYQTATIAAWLMPVVALVLIGLAVAVSARRWRMFLAIVVGTGLSLAFVGLVLQPVKSSILANVADDGLRSAVSSAAQVTFSTLRTGVFVTLVVAVVAALILFLSGRSGAAVSIRETAGHVPGVAARYRGAFIVGGVVATLVVLAVIPGRSWAQFLTGMLLLAAYVLAVLLAPMGGGVSGDEDTVVTGTAT